MPIRVELELDDGSFTSRMIHAGETVQQFRGNVQGAVVGVQRLNEHSQTLIGTLRDISITLGMARIAFDGLRQIGDGWVGDIVKINGEMERLKFLLAGMSKAADPMKDASLQVKYLRDFAKDAPFSLAALSDTFVKLKSTGIDPTAGALKGLVDGVAAFGGNEEVLKRATVALQQMSGKGVIQMEELRQQLGEAVPRAVELMARSMGMTTGELIKEVSKGTLDAKSSLQAFTMELDRTFGGAAQTQMNTFNGLVSRTKTLMQTLALDAGESGFFNAVKDQVRQLNESLSGDKFISMATTVGRFMGSVVTGLGNAIQTLLHFKDEIILTGEVLAIAFGVSTTAKGLAAFGNMVTGMREGLALIRLESSQTFRAMAGSGGLVMGIRSATDAWAALKLSTEGFALSMTRLLPLLGAGIAFVAEWALPIALLGAAVYGLWQAFGAGKSKVQEAYDGMVKFGAETEAQILLAEQHAKALRDQVTALEDLKKAEEENSKLGLGGGVSVSNEDISKKRKEAEDAEANVAKGKEDLAKKNADKLLRTLETQLEEQQNRRKAARDQDRIADAKAYDDQIKALTAANKDISMVQKAHQDELHAKEMAYYKQQIEDAAAQQVELQMMANSGDKAAQDILEKRTAQLAAIMVDRQQQVDTFANMKVGPVDIGKPINMDKLLQQAKTKLDSLKGDIAAQQAQLQGVNGEYARMAFLIENAAAKSNGMYTTNEPAIKAIVDQLKEAQIESDKLQEKIKGLTDYNNDLGGAEAKATQELIKQVTHGKDGLDAIAAKKIAGLYDGKTPIERMMSGVTSGAEEAGKAMDQAFGSGMQSKGTTLTSIVERLGVAWKGVRDNAAGVANESMSLEHQTYKPGSTYSQNLIHHESGGRADATNADSSAVGLGQFLKSTWLEFLKSEHPEILAGGEKAALATRTDEQLQQEAIAYYAAKNAGKLEEKGIPADDANVYLAHFLGPGGAIAALTKSSDTLLSSIKGLDGARAANPQVFADAKTVGGLQEWARSFMGKASTFSRQGSSSFAVDTLLPGSNQGQQDEILKIQAITDRAKALAGKNNLADDMKAAALSIKEAADQQDGLNKHLAATKKLIAEGRYGIDKDPQSEQYKGWIKLAQDWDKADAEALEKKKSRDKANSIIEKLPSEADILADKQAEADRRLQDATKFKFSPGYYTQARTTNKDVEALQQDSENRPENADRNQKAIAERQSQLEQMRNLEIQNAVITEQEKMKAVARSLMTTREAQDAQLRDDIARQQNYLALYTGDAEKRTQIEAQVTRNIELLRRQQFDLTPIGGMLKQWRDFSNNLEQAATGWMNGFNDKLADMVMHGRVNFKSLTDSILKDLITISLKAGESKLFTSLLGGSFLGGGAAATTSGLDALAAIHHTGGVAGANMPMRKVNPLMFAGAHRYHTGTGGLTLGADEIPIIAKRGEQVDWPDNLAKQYGGRGGNFSMGDIHVNGGATNGSPSQNKDLAQQIAQQVRQAASEMMGKEMRTQMRPGGTLHAMKRG